MDWHWKNFIDAMAKYAELVGFDKNTSKITDLIDRYLVEVAPTYKGSLTQAKFLRSGLGDIPYSASSFASIWQRKMKKAMEAGMLKERFTDHDLRAKTGSDAELEHATKLLPHLDPKVTRKHYRRKVPVVRPLR